MAEVDNGMDTMQPGTVDNNLLDADVGYPLKRETDPMSQSMYDASTSDPMSQSMYGYDNSLADAGSESTPIPAQFDSLCSNGDAQYSGYTDQGLLNGGATDSGAVPEGMLIDFGGQNQNPFEAPVPCPEPVPQPEPVVQPDPEPHPEPVVHAEPVSHPEPVVHPDPVTQEKQTESPLLSEESGKSQLSEQRSEKAATVDDLITTELSAASLNEVKSAVSSEVSTSEQSQATESVGDKMDVGGDLMEGGLAMGQGTQPVNGDIGGNSAGYTEINQTSTTVTETTTVNGEMSTQVTQESTKTHKESRIPQKPPSPRKSRMPVQSPTQPDVELDVGPGWDDSITVTRPRPPVSAHLLPRNMKDYFPEETPPRPGSARASVERKKYGIDSKRPDYRPGGGDVTIFSEKKEYKAEKRIDSRASPAPRTSPKPTTPRTPPVNTPSPKLTGVKSKIGSMDKASHTPGGGNVRIVTKKSDYATVGSRVGSKDKIQHKPGGGNVKIENKKLAMDSVGSRIGSMDNAKHKAGGGDKKIESKALSWEVKSKVGSMDNAKHVAGGGEKKIESKKLEWKKESRVGSMDNSKHKAGGGAKKILDEKVEVKAESKVGSLKNVKHAPGGGDKAIETQKLNFRETAKARTKHGLKDEDESRRSNSVTSQSTADGSQ